MDYLILAIIVAAWIFYIVTTHKCDKDLRRKINTILEFHYMQLNPLASVKPARGFAMKRQCWAVYANSV